MTLASILAFIAIAFGLSWVRSGWWRSHLLLGTSTLALYALQPNLPVRFLDFWLPTATLAVAMFGWGLTTPRESRSWRTNWSGIALPGALVLALGLLRYLPASLPWLPVHPPQLGQVAVGVGLIGLGIVLSGRFSRPGKATLAAGTGVILLFFIFLKFPPFTEQASILLRALNRQSVETASAFDIRWLGFSYIAFRILHTIRDRHSGRLPVVSLSEYLTYIIFFPTLAAGPIDRLERFVPDLRKSPDPGAEDWSAAGSRLVFGLFKKFAIADTLALVALNGTNALQVQAPGWTWVLLYAYTFQIYFDFSGYTDIAIGLGRLMGFNLPENFNRPYLRPNLTQFWNNWHMTLTQWFRAYFFNPVTRALRSRNQPLPIPAIIFITQVATMLLIGLWHGMTWNFAVWGLWHGLGLFVHNRWSERTRARFAQIPIGWQKALNAGGVLLTFHFVALGWAFFALPDLASSLFVLIKLYGGG